MIVKSNFGNSKKPKNLISQSEILKIFENKASNLIFPSFFDNIQRDNIDEPTFVFLFRKIYPILDKAFRIPNIKKTSNNLECLDSEKLLVLGKAIGNVCFGIEIFLKYFSKEDIVGIFEAIDFCNETVKKALENLLEQILLKFHEVGQLYKDTIANKLLLYSSNPKYQNDVDFLFRLILNMLENDILGNDIPEFYLQFILPLIVYCSVENLELAKNVIGKVSSISPECQRISLSHFLKIYPTIGSNEQIKILDLTNTVIHHNFFFKSKSFLGWELSNIINMALKSESFIVIDTVIDMIDNSSTKTFIEDNIRIILPRIFNNIYKLSKKFWKQEQRFKAIKTIGNILNIDNDVFEACLVEYNKNKQSNLESNLIYNYRDFDETL